MRLFVAEVILIRIACALLLLSSSICLAQSPDDRYWDDRFGRSEIVNDYSADNTYVNTLAASGDYILVGGRFTSPARRLALWNRSTKTWVSGFDGIPGNDAAAAMTWDIAVVGATAYVRGSFSDALHVKQYAFGSVDLSTKKWTPDTSLVGDVRDFCVMGSDLIVSGSFTIKGTAIKNCGIIRNGKWLPFSNDSTMNRSGEVVVFMNTLYMAQSVGRRMILNKWTGSAWEPLIDSLVYRLGSFPTARLVASNSRLFICAPSDSVYIHGSGLVKGNWLYAYNGSTWESLITSYVALQFSTIDVTPVMATHGDDMYMMGPFSSIDGTSVNAIACWSAVTKSWKTLGGGVTAKQTPWLNPFRAIVCDSTDLYAAGIISTAGGKAVSNIARFSFASGQWYSLNSQLSLGLDDRSTLLVDRGRILSFGSFNVGGDVNLNGIGYWNGAGWQQLGPGLIGGTGYLNDGKLRTLSIPQGLYACTRFRDTLILAGEYGFISSLTCDNIARFDNGILDCVGGGLHLSHFGSSGHFETPAFVSDVLSVKDKLFVCGDFGKSGGVTVQIIAEWDGLAWRGLTSTLLCDSYTSFRLAQDSTHSLLMFGSFSMIDGKECNGIARWDGTAWTAIGYSPEDSTHKVTAACVAANGDIIVAGNFRNKNGTTMRGLARWDGTQWHELGGGLNVETDYISTMAVDGDRLFVAGNFQRIASIDAPYVAMLNLKTLTWTSLGSGFSIVRDADTLTRTIPAIRSISILRDTVYFGGSFRYAGLQSASNIAAWTKPFVTEVEQNNDPWQGLELQVNPNPATSDVTLRWSLPTSGWTQLLVYDLMGREVQRALDQQQSPGSYQMRVSTSTLATGTYLVRCVSASGSVAKVLRVIHD